MACSFIRRASDVEVGSWIISRSIAIASWGAICCSSCALAKESVVARYLEDILETKKMYNPKSNSFAQSLQNLKMNHILHSLFCKIQRQLNFIQHVEKNHINQLICDVQEKFQVCFFYLAICQEGLDPLSCTDVGDKNNGHIQKQCIKIH